MHSAATSSHKFGGLNLQGHYMSHFRGLAIGMTRICVILQYFNYLVGWTFALLSPYDSSASAVDPLSSSSTVTSA